MIDWEQALAHVRGIAARHHSARFVDTLPAVLESVVQHGGSLDLRPAGLAWIWPIDGRRMPVLSLYVDESCCLELNSRRVAVPVAFSNELESRLAMALPPSGGTPGLRPNFDASALVQPDSLAALGDVLAWLEEQSAASAPIATPSATRTVETAVRASVSADDVLLTPTGRASFSVAGVRSDGVVLLFGAKESPTLLRWPVLEGALAYLRGGGWVPLGGGYSPDATPDTFDAYLKRHINRASAGYVAVLLERAGLVDVDRSRPSRVRSRSGQ